MNPLYCRRSNALTENQVKIETSGNPLNRYVFLFQLRSNECQDFLFLIVLIVRSLAKNHFALYPVRSMIQYSFPVNEYLKQVKAAITILHGTDDEVIPFNQGLN